MRLLRPTLRRQRPTLFWFVASVLLFVAPSLSSGQQIQEDQPVIRFVGHPDPAPEFKLTALGGKPLTIAAFQGKVIFLNFWATWCGPCRELEPHFEKVAMLYSMKPDVIFYALNCDDDESLVAPFLAEEKPKTSALFADGLDRLLRVDSFPTTVVLDRSGKIAFRVDGFDPEGFEKSLSDAIERAAQPANNGSPSAARRP